MENRTKAQVISDLVTTYSGSWSFVVSFTGLCVAWVLLNTSGHAKFDPPPFLLLNWVLTVVSTMQSPLIMMSNNRQNDVDREHVQEILQKLDRLEKIICGHDETVVR